MKTCYLHLGMPKTGSTSIQRAFHDFRDGDIRYAELEESNHGLPLISAFSGKPQDFYILKNRGIGAAAAREMGASYREQITAIAESDGDVIFSSEAVPDHMTPEDIEGMIAFFQARAEAVKVIFYARPVSALVSSQFQENIKHGVATFKLPAPKYRKRFEMAVNAVGRGNVTFVRFAREDLVGGDIVQDFAHRIGVATPPHGVVGNESLSVEAVGHIYLFNKVIAPQLPAKQRVNVRNTLKKRLVNFGGQKFMLHPDLIRQHIADHQDDIRWAEETCGFDLTGEVNPAISEGLVASEADLLRFISG
jgi:hypothetical protein